MGMRGNTLPSPSSAISDPSTSLSDPSSAFENRTNKSRRGSHAMLLTFITSEALGLAVVCYESSLCPLLGVSVRWERVVWPLSYQIRTGQTRLPLTGHHGPKPDPSHCGKRSF